jgi:hypothetical protein
MRDSQEHDRIAEVRADRVRSRYGAFLPTLRTIYSYSTRRIRSGRVVRGRPSTVGRATNAMSLQMLVFGPFGSSNS